MPRFHLNGDWKDVVRNVLQPYGGVIPSEWTQEEFIIKVAEAAGHPNPHHMLPGAKQAIRDLLDSKEITHGKGSRPLRTGKTAIKRRELPSKTPQNDIRQSGLLTYLSEIHRAVLLFGDKLRRLEEEFAMWKREGKKIDFMRTELENLVAEVVGEIDTPHEI